MLYINYIEQAPPISLLNQHSSSVGAKLYAGAGLNIRLVSSKSSQPGTFYRLYCAISLN